MAKLVLEHLLVGPLQSNCFIIGDEETGEAVIIDPGGDGDQRRKGQDVDPPDARAEALKLDPSLLFTKAQITELAVKNPASLEHMAECELLKDWQIRTFGRELLDATPLGQEPPPSRRRRRRRRSPPPPR